MSNRRIGTKGSSAGASGSDPWTDHEESSALHAADPDLLYIFQRSSIMRWTWLIVGHYLGEQSLAAVGANVAIFDLMVMFAQSLGNGLCIVVSRAYGAGDAERLRKSVAGSLVISVGTTLAMTVMSLLGPGTAAASAGNAGSHLRGGGTYIRIIGWIVVTFAYNLLSSLLRAIRDSAMSLVFLIISSVLNVILDLVLVAGIGMGVQGAAAATVIARESTLFVLCAGYIWTRAEVFDSEKGGLELRQNTDARAGRAGRYADGLHGLGGQRRIGDPAVWHQQPGGDRDRGAHNSAEAVHAVRAAKHLDENGNFHICLAEQRRGDSGRGSCRSQESYVYDLVCCPVHGPCAVPVCGFELIADLRIHQSG